jgi:lysophospholipase L1-like esterase
MPQHDHDTPRVPSIPAPPTGRHLAARDALICIGLCALLLLCFEGRSMRHSGEEMRAGWERSLVLAVGRPAGAFSDALGLADVKDKLVGWVHPDEALSGPGGFDSQSVSATVSGVPPVTPDAFDPRALGARPAAPRPLRTVLVTGDSLSQPLDARVARAFSKSGRGVKVVRDSRIGTGISQSDLVDWGQLAVDQVAKRRPDGVVVFMGANEGFAMRSGARTVKCCGPPWAAEYASRVRQVMDTYRQRGAARVYWLNLPMPRDGARQQIARSVNAAIAVAAEPYRAQVRVLDMAALFTPAGRYRDAMDVGGQRRIVRESDGIHINGEGADVALAPVLAALRADFGARVPR